MPQAGWWLRAWFEKGKAARNLFSSSPCYNQFMENHSQPYAKPLATALKSIAFAMESESKACVTVATRYKHELKLPDHVGVTSRPLRGRRVAHSGVRNFRTSRVRLAHWPEDGVDESSSPHLMCVINGQADIVAGDYMLHCRPGDFVLLPAGVPKRSFLPYVLSGNLQRNCSVFWFFPGRLLGEGLECWISHSHGNTYKTGLECGAALVKNRSLAHMFTQLCDELQSQMHQAIVYHLLLGFVLLLQRELESGRSYLPDTKRLHRPLERSSHSMEHAKAYIESNLDKHLTIEVLARELAMSPTSFKQRFRAEMNMTFHEYLTRCRAEYATALLTTTELKVEDVAASVGLKYTQFRQLFYEQIGCSPSQYRKLHCR